VKFAADREPRNEIMEVMMRNDWTLLAMESVEMSLEDIFLQLTTREETDS
jgi:hypothetical protein